MGLGLFVFVFMLGFVGWFTIGFCGVFYAYRLFSCLFLLFSFPCRLLVLFVSGFGFGALICGFYAWLVLFVLVCYYIYYFLLVGFTCYYFGFIRV